MTQLTLGLGRLLRVHREEHGISQRALAGLSGVTSVMITYLEAGSRQPSRDTVLKLAKALSLTSTQTDELLVAARHLPTAYDRLSPLDPDLLAIADVLGDEDIPPDQRKLLRIALRVVLGRWRPALATTLPDSDY